LFSLQTNLSKSFLNRFDKKTAPEEKDPPKKEDKRERIYDIVRARKRDPKGAQKKQNEKRKKILRKKTFQSQKGGRLRKEEDTKGREG
ncbi:hypothetical protein HMPREF1555_01856, partial [Porphyromonas gingivalis F0570]